MADPITNDDVAHVARLARLVLTDEEVRTYTEQLADVLSHAEDVAALDLTDLAPTHHPYPLRNVLRPDVATPTLDRDEIFSTAPSVEDDRFRVPPVLGDDA